MTFTISEGRSPTVFEAARCLSGAMEASDLRRCCPLDPAAQRLLSRLRAARALGARPGPCPRGLPHIADLAGADRIAPAHVAEAIQYRTFDRPTLREAALGWRVGA